MVLRYLGPDGYKSTTLAALLPFLSTPLSLHHLTVSTTPSSLIHHNFLLLFAILAALGGLAGTATAHHRHKSYIFSDGTCTLSALDGTLNGPLSRLLRLFAPLPFYVTSTITVTIGTNLAVVALRTNGPTLTGTVPSTAPGVTHSVTTSNASLDRRDTLAPRFPQLVPEGTDGVTYFPHHLAATCQSSTESASSASPTTTSSEFFVASFTSSTSSLISPEALGMAIFWPLLVLLVALFGVGFGYMLKRRGVGARRFSRLL
ncbi:hypothetical protein BU16DRAFT_578523 [Lophium mytilinum]|uniref:Uncharacterized protein n=1 Tax=Lophium mytilinum TaxID=390894 RepID=A0A6A6RA33_9PEZI|nr:hypothetical protein BU16DRAFT_578523 [Lophium mytilinum]